MILGMSAIGFAIRRRQKPRVTGGAHELASRLKLSSENR